MPDEPRNLKAALWYAKHGFSPIPVKGKSQHLIKWKPHQDRIATEDEIRQWWQRWPDANVGLVTGPVSNLLVVDVDTQEAWEALQEFIPETHTCPTARSPRGGYHLYYKHEAGFSNRAGYLPNVDVRTSGGFIMAPPSVNGKGAYRWHDGCKLEVNCNVDTIPSLLKNKLISSLESNNKIINGETDRVCDKSGNFVNSCESVCFEKGKRNDSLFHVANCLVKGGCTQADARNILVMLAKTCSPPFPESELKTVIESALERTKKREGNITGELRQFAFVNNCEFNVKEVENSLQIVNLREKATLRKALQTLCSEGIIEKTAAGRGWYRSVDKELNEVDWCNATTDYQKLWLPLDLDTMTGVLPGNILMVAGAKDSGKTAWLMNIARENSHWYKTRYINSEMGEAEFKLRMSKFPEPVEDMAKRISMCCHSSNIPDKILPGAGNLNVIDFLEVVTDFWKVAETIKQIHEKLDGAIAVIAIQKKRGAEFGRGGEFSLEKSRLYVALDYGKAKIISCKNFKPSSPVGNPRGYVCDYKLVDGCRIMKQPPGWKMEG